MPLRTASHPLIAHKMTYLRDKKTNPKDFRQMLKEITFYLGFEATRDLKVTEKKIVTPMNVSFQGSKVSESVAIVPIMRAGLVMADGLLELIPDASIHHIGMYRAKESLLPIQYYNRLPKNHAADVAFVLAPCIATANTLNAVLSILSKWGAKRIVIIAAIGARPGVDRLLELHPEVEMCIAALDEELSEDGMILPGIGDAGVRQFGGDSQLIPDLLPSDPLTPLRSKRKRASSSSSSSGGAAAEDGDDA